jgi:hypothetical protein
MKYGLSLLVGLFVCLALYSGASASSGVWYAVIASAPGQNEATDLLSPVTSFSQVGPFANQVVCQGELADLQAIQGASFTAPGEGSSPGYLGNCFDTSMKSHRHAGWMLAILSTTNASFDLVGPFASNAECSAEATALRTIQNTGLAPAYQFPNTALCWDTTATTLSSAN